MTQAKFPEYLSPVHESTFDVTSFPYLDFLQNAGIKRSKSDEYERSSTTYAGRLHAAMQAQRSPRQNGSVEKYLAIPGSLSTW